MKHSRWIKFRGHNEDSGAEFKRMGIVLCMTNPIDCLKYSTVYDVDKQCTVCPDDIIQWDYYLPTVEELISKLKPNQNEGS